VGHFREEVAGFAVPGADFGRVGDNKKDVFHFILLDWVLRMSMHPGTAACPLSRVTPGLQGLLQEMA
jgi:hypothetical protein